MRHSVRILMLTAFAVALQSRADPVAAQPVLSQVQKLIPSNTGNGGNPAAISGNTAVMTGVIDEGTNPRAVFVFERDPATNTWSEVKTLMAGGPVDAFGASVAISGDTIVAGAPQTDIDGVSFVGAAYVFERDQGGDGNWGQVAQLTVSGAPGTRFGDSVAIDGATLAVGAPSSVLGIVYVFERIGGAWTQTDAATELGTTGFGADIALDGDTLVAGASGSAWVFGRDQGGTDSWGKVAELTHTPQAAPDGYGRSVAVHGDTAVVGARNHDEVPTLEDQGTAYVFERNQGGADAWGQVTRLTASDGDQEDGFGVAVAVRGDLLVVGTERADGIQSDTGAAYSFGRNHGGANAWGQIQKLVASDGTPEDFFGAGLALTGGSLVGFTLILEQSGDFFGDAHGAYIFGNTRPRPIVGDVSGALGSGGATLQIASISDGEQSPETLIARVNGGESATVNGVTVANLAIEADGDVLADVEVACGASDASFELSFTDAVGEVTTATLAIEVTPSAAPELTLRSPFSLWPPSPFYWPIPAFALVASATDDCDGDLRHDVVIEQVTSDEPDDAPGLHDGRTRHDIIAPFCELAFLRAERSVTGNGRVYGVTLRVRDSEGSETRAVFPIGVPITRRGAAVEDPPAQTVATGCP